MSATAKLIGAAQLRLTAEEVEILDRARAVSGLRTRDAFVKQTVMHEARRLAALEPEIVRLRSQGSASPGSPA